MFKVIIAGSRTYSDFEKLCQVCDYLLQYKSDIEIVSGHHKDGADKLGEEYAKQRGYPVQQFPADWDRHGRAAGPIRNSEMAEYGDALIAFLDEGRCRGTKDMIYQAKEKVLLIRVVDRFGEVFKI